MNGDGGGGGYSILERIPFMDEVTGLGGGGGGTEISKHTRTIKVYGRESRKNRFSEASPRSMTTLGKLQDNCITHTQ